MCLAIESNGFKLTYAFCKTVYNRKTNLIIPSEIGDFISPISEGIIKLFLAARFRLMRYLELKAHFEI